LEVSVPEVELSAGTIEYEDTGGPGPVIVFVHGLMMDGSLWRHVVADLRRDYRCVMPTLPLGAHRRPMRPDADLSMRGMVEILGEFIQALDLREITLAMNDWGGPLLLLGGAHDACVARLVVCSCEAFDNVPPRGAAKLLPYTARIPGGLDVALFPFRFDRLRRLPMTYGPLSRRPVPREVMDRWFGPIRERQVRRDIRKYVRSAAQGRREMLAATDALAAFDRPALVAWASEDRLMPPEHGRRLAELLPQAHHVQIADSYTLIPEDQPATLTALMRKFLAQTPPTAQAGPVHRSAPAG
jgi:pimeloyl-ACP methyl ester carboxylesterase